MRHEQHQLTGLGGPSRCSTCVVSDVSECQSPCACLQRYARAPKLEVAATATYGTPCLVQREKNFGAAPDNDRPSNDRELSQI